MEAETGGEPETASTNGPIKSERALTRRESDARAAARDSLDKTEERSGQATPRAGPKGPAQWRPKTDQYGSGDG